MRKNFLSLLLLFVFLIPGIFSLFHSGFFQSDDGGWMIIRFSAFHQALRDGQFPVRWIGRLNYEYGYPVSDFLYPGFMYIGEIFHVIGIGFINTIKLLFGLSLILSSVCTFFWLSRFFSRFQSFVGALVSAYLPYHLYDIYTRGSLGEVLALAFAPFIFWQIERKSIVWTGVGVMSLLLSHNTLAFLFLPIIIIYSILRFMKETDAKKTILQYSFALLLGILSAAFFWIPAFFDLHYTVFSQTSVSDWQKYFADNSILGVMSVLICIIAGIILLWVSVKKIQILTPNVRYFAWYFLLLSVISLFFSTQFSSIFWQIVQIPIRFIQFPFRLLSLALITTAFLTAFILSVIPKRLRGVVGSLFLITTFLLSYQYMTPKTFLAVDNNFYATNEASTTVKNEYMPKWVKEVPTARPVNKIIGEHTSITNEVIKTNKLQFATDSQSTATITINTIYFPGWYASIDGKQTAIHYTNPMGRIQFLVPAGHHLVTVRFQETPIRLISDLLSLSSLSVLVIWSIIRTNSFLWKRFSFIKK